MKEKIFKIRMSGKVWCEKNIENCLQFHHTGKVEVTELPPEKKIEKLKLAFSGVTTNQIEDKINETIDIINKRGKKCL